MKAHYSPDNLPATLAPIRIRYGQEVGIEEEWKEIIKEDDEIVFKSKIDSLVQRLENNSSENAFFCSKEKIDTGGFGRGFVLDDMELYYDFFSLVKETKQFAESESKNIPDGKILNLCIKSAINIYAGLGNPNREKRLQLTTPSYDEDGNESTPSIKFQKKQKTFLCTEKAAIAHNLWLLLGKKSYFCFTKCDNFDGAGLEYKDDAHNFTIVEYDGTFKLYDIALDNFCLLDNDCIDNLLSGKGLEVTKVKNPGCYCPNFTKERNI